MAEYSIAPMYDLLLYPFVQKIRKKILKHCVSENYQSIIDVCCGTGNQLKLLKKHGFQVTGIDLSTEMLQVSKKGKYAPDCRHEDAARMSFPDNRYDMAMTTFALHEKEGPVAREILREMIRVVRPGGRILLIDFYFTSRSSHLSKSIISLIERNAGGDHFRNFREFIRYGGISALMDGFPLKIDKMEYAGMRSIGMFILRNEKTE